MYVPYQAPHVVCGHRGRYTHIQVWNKLASAPDIKDHGVIVQMLCIVRRGGITGNNWAQDVFI